MSCVHFLAFTRPQYFGGKMACMEIVAGDEPSAGQERGGWGLSVVTGCEGGRMGRNFRATYVCVCVYVCVYTCL